MLSIATLLSSRERCVGMMTARQSSDGAKDLYACGAGVHVPSIRVRENGRRRSGSAAGGAHGVSRSEQRRRRTVAGERDNLLHSHVGELRRSLTFTEDVVSSRSPHSISYKQARSRLTEVFLPSLPPDCSSPRREKFGNRRVHDIKRHLCYLSGPPCLQVHDRPTSTRYSHFEPASQLLSNSSVHRVPSHPSGMLYRRLRTVPVAKSVQWEAKVLGEVTSSTAVRLGGGSRGENVLQKEEEERSGIVENEVDGAGGEEKEGERKKENYVACLGRGAKPVWKRGREHTIILDNNTTFTKVLEKSYPQPHSEWCGTEEEDKSVVKGGRRWRALPQPASTPRHLQWVCDGRSPTEADSYLDTETGKSSPHLDGKGLTPQHQYCHILKEWSRRRSIHVQPEDATEAAILRNLHSLNDSSRKMGMVACVDLRLSQSVCDSGVVGEVVRELERIVEDEGSSGVHVPAAIALHCLGRVHQTAVRALLAAVRRRGGDNVDEWAGLQCLVESGVCEECVVERLQRFFLNSSSSSLRLRAGDMMARLSNRMPLVHALLAEQLTSRGWQERLSACRVLPSLLCPLSADVCNHLVVMSWEDWSSDVRDAASQALGKTGHGKLLHDELVRRLSEGTEMERLDALKKISSLELMTPQLLSVFLHCLSDLHTSIRLEAIAICGQLAVKDEAVLQSLIHLLGDSVWTIRAHTLRALRSIGCGDRDVMEQLLWSVRCDKVPAVRAEACHTLSHLWQKSREGERGGEEEEMKSRVISTLRDRLVVEDSVMVTQELVQALREMGESVEREDPMASFIASEVRRLGTSKAILQGVLEGDQQTLTDYVIRRPLTHLTTRDYLTPHQRQKYYSQNAAKADEEGAESTCKRVWSPDQETIEKHLKKIQQLCLSSKPPSL